MNGKLGKVVIWVVILFVVLAVLTQYQPVNDGVYQVLNAAGNQLDHLSAALQRKGNS